jgi:Transglycosylase SLT domain
LAPGGGSMRSGVLAVMWFAGFAVLVQPHADAAKVSANAKPPATIEKVKELIEKKPASVQVVTFPATGWNSIRVVRGGTKATNAKPGAKPAEKAETVEIVTFGDAANSPVRVLRGESEHAAALPEQPPRASAMTSELVAFSDPRIHPVTVFRGSLAQSPPAIELFGPARDADLDRVAFAVDGAESSHGADPRMWRAEISGPQGPMQVSAAAAADIGGGDRFDSTENRQLGRAYLAHLYRRYGNWPDAIAAYNWGPGNMDSWIGSGRPIINFPLEVERYRNRVLRDVGLELTSGRTLLQRASEFTEIVPEKAW